MMTFNKSEPKPLYKPDTANSVGIGLRIEAKNGPTTTIVNYKLLGLPLIVNITLILLHPHVVFEKIDRELLLVLGVSNYCNVCFVKQRNINYKLN